MAAIDPKLAPYCPNVGGGNDPPSPMSEVPIGEFWFEFMHQTVIHQEYRQVFLYPADRATIRLTSCQIFWFHDRAYLIFADGRASSNPKTKNGLPYRYQSMKCFRVGCDHEYTETTPHMHEHVYTCSKCGYRYATDSSG